MNFEAELKKFELSSVFTINFLWLKRYVESDNGMYTPMKNISDDEFREIESSFYALQATWKAWMEAKAQAVPEGFVLVPRVITDEWMAVYVDPVVTKYCKDYEDLPFSVEESELPEIRESHRLPIRNAHKRLMQVIEAQEQSHENG